MLVHGKHFQPSLVFVGEARSLKGASLGWKGWPGTNTLASYENLYISAVKSFTVQAPGANVIKLFTAVSYEFL